MEPPTDSSGRPARRRAGGVDRAKLRRSLNHGVSDNTRAMYYSA